MALGPGNMKMLRWAPAALLAIGCLLSLGLRPQQEMPLRMSLSAAVPEDLVRHMGADIQMNAAEHEVSGVTDYLFRAYETERADSSNHSVYSVYVGYYDSQTRGRTIHSPKNCLPGGGWEALSSTTAQVTTALGVVTVNRYLLHREGEQALVLYWYQGRGRVESNEYRVKADLLRDVALKRRSEEALVRIVVPIRKSEEAAYQLAEAAAIELVPAVDRALPN